MSWDNIHWKDLSLVLIVVLQAIIGFMWLDMKSEVEENHTAIDTHLRQTAGDNAALQLIIVQGNQIIRDEMSSEMRNLRTCINANIVEGRSVVCN